MPRAKLGAKFAEGGLKIKKYRYVQEKEGVQIQSTHHCFVYAACATLVGQPAMEI